MDEWMATAQRDGEVKKRRRERKEKSKRDVTFMAGKNSCCVKITVCSYCVCLCVYEWGGGSLIQGRSEEERSATDMKAW